MAKIICYGEEARKALEKGVDQLVTPSRSLGSQGPQRGAGQEVRRPLITNDGVTIAKEIELEDPFGRTWGAQLVKEVSHQDQ